MLSFNEQMPNWVQQRIQGEIPTGAHELNLFAVFKGTFEMLS